MFKSKSKFNPRNKDAAIELYLSSLEEKLMKVEVPKDKFNNLTNSERKALYDLKNDKSIIIKSWGFTPHKAEQALRGMELQEKKHKKDYRIYRKSV